MIRALWSSLAQVESSLAVEGKPIDLAALFRDWHAATDKGGFMAQLDLLTAQALTDYIMGHTPKGQPTAKARRKLPDPSLLPDPQK